MTFFRFIVSQRPVGGQVLPIRTAGLVQATARSTTRSSRRVVSSRGRQPCSAETVITSTERLVDTNGVQLAGNRGRRPRGARGGAGARLPGAGVLLATPDPGPGRCRLPRAGPRSARLRRLDRTARGRRLRHRGPDRRHRRPARRRRRARRPCCVGHDWGSVVATNFPLLHPDRVSACVALSVPPIPRPPVPPTEAWRERLRRELLLHPLLPGARHRRRRTRR